MTFWGAYVEHLHSQSSQRSFCHLATVPNYNYQYVVRHNHWRWHNYIRIYLWAFCGEISCIFFHLLAAVNDIFRNWEFHPKQINEDQNSLAKAESTLICSNLVRFPWWLWYRVGKLLSSLKKAKPNCVTCVISILYIPSSMRYIYVC